MLLGLVLGRPGLPVLLGPMLGLPVGTYSRSDQNLGENVAVKLASAILSTGAAQPGDLGF